jgi:hypothetical protein
VINEIINGKPPERTQDDKLINMRIERSKRLSQTEERQISFLKDLKK